MPIRFCWCIIDINGFRIVYIPLEVGVIVAWQGVGGIGMGSGIRISDFFCGGALVICTGGKFGWNIGFLNVTIFAPSCFCSVASFAFFAFFFDFLDFPVGGCGGGGSGIIMVFGVSVKDAKKMLL